MMTRKAESFCCQESPPAMALMPQGTTCACDLKDFEAVVRSRSVLIVFLRTYREFRGGGINEGNNRSVNMKIVKVDMSEMIAKISL